MPNRSTGNRFQQASRVISMTGKKHVPSPQDCDKIATKAHQFIKLLVDLLQLVSRYGAYQFARDPAAITSFQYPCKFINAETQGDRATDELYTEQSLRRIRPIAALCAWRRREQALAFVVAQCIRTYAG